MAAAMPEWNLTSARLLPSLATLPIHARSTFFPAHAAGGKGFGELLKQRNSKGKDQEIPLSPSCGFGGDERKKKSLLDRIVCSCGGGDNKLPYTECCMPYHNGTALSLLTPNQPQIPRPSLLCFNTRLRNSSSFVVSAAASSDDAGSSSSSSSNKQNLPIQSRRRHSSWEDLSTPVPEPPNYLLLAAGFSIVYLARQAVAAELIQWVSLVAILGLTIIRFTQRLLVALLRKALHFVKVPIAFVMTLAGWSGLLARDIYSLIVNTTSIWPTSKALLLVTLVLSVGEATRSTAVSGQPWSLLLASAFGVGAVWGVIHHTIFVLLLLLLTGFSLLVQKKDAVSAAMPATAVLVAIAEPPLKAVALALFLAVAVYTHWKSPEEQVESPASSMRTVQPLLMVVAALFVGLTAGSRYLRAWQILWLAK